MSFCGLLLTFECVIEGTRKHTARRDAREALLINPRSCSSSATTPESGIGTCCQLIGTCWAAYFPFPRRILLLDLMVGFANPPVSGYLNEDGFTACICFIFYEELPGNSAFPKTGRSGVSLVSLGLGTGCR